MVLLPCHACISILLIIVAAWNFVVELIRNLLNSFPIDGHNKLG